MTQLSSLPVEFLFHFEASLAAPIPVPNGPQGTRLIVPITGGTISGPKINGTVESLGADWLTMRTDGSAQLDVRALLRTDDGAVIHTSYKGLMTPGETGPRIVTAPLFETGDEKYLWLNHVQAIALGAPGQGAVAYDVYKIL